MGRAWNWFFLLILCSCLKDVEPGQHYVFYIPKGNHYSIQTLTSTSEKTITFAFRFDNSAIYNLGDLDQFDTNKLFGIKYGINPHKNSARFGWRWDLDNQYVVITAYSYINGMRDIYEIGYCFVHEIYSCEIQETATQFIYKFQGKEYSISKNKNSGKRYYSFPYFGGNKKAPHDITIELWF